jgi:hypothetical protein
MLTRRYDAHIPFRGVYCYDRMANRLVGKMAYVRPPKTEYRAAAELMCQIASDAKTETERANFRELGLLNLLFDISDMLQEIRPDIWEKSD